MKTAEIIFTENTIKDGYGLHRLAICNKSIGNLKNMGYNVFIGNITNIHCENLPDKIDLAESYKDMPNCGWIYIDFTDKREKMFVTFDSQGNSILQG